MGVRSLGVRLASAAGGVLDALLLRGVAAMGGCFDAARGAAALGALRVPGSGRSGISGSTASPGCGKDAVCQLSSDLIASAADGVGACTWRR